jgi:hypothetical protein
VRAISAIPSMAAGLLLVPVGAIVLLIACVILLSLGTAVLVGGLVPVRRGADALIRDT